MNQRKKYTNATIAQNIKDMAEVRMLMTNEEMQVTLSKAMYWDEVIKRDNGCEILKQESFT
jgi:hypothetical protein